MKVDCGESQHFCDDPICHDPVWKLSKTARRPRTLDDLCVDLLDCFDASYLARGKVPCDVHGAPSLRPWGISVYCSLNELQESLQYIADLHFNVEMKYQESLQYIADLSFNVEINNL